MKVSSDFKCDQRAEQVLKLSKEVLGSNLIEIGVVALKLSENFETSKATFEAKLLEISQGQPKEKNITGEGVGLVDACFDALIKCYNQTFCSLDSISIEDFIVSVHLERASLRKSDSKISALLRVKNSLDHEYSFQSTTTSISRSSVSVVQEAVAFFINAEFAYEKLYRALEDAKERARHDLVERYQNQMATLVHATSYEKLVEKLRKEKK
ncbi:MAG: hypothetical protein KC505_01295 [Myxococcales bacterium]|nr:hypothetical protein [Myxococcales bacterium]USN51281.1 MAG: hypothetical protein H6731_02420 [Myxococcales bacterium]